MTDADRRCAAEGCKRRVGPGVLMCYPHWSTVPKALQARIYRTWRRGRPTTDYPQAVRDAVAAAKEAER